MNYLEQYWQKGGTYVIPVEVINQLSGEIEEIIEENERLHSIIKEVREYGKEVLSWTTNEPITDEIGEHILEIVDKESKE